MIVPLLSPLRLPACATNTLHHNTHHTPHTHTHTHTSLWNYCTVGPHALSIFAFDMYDCDSSGTIDKDEIRLMLKEVYGDEFDRNEFAHRILA